MHSVVTEHVFEKKNCYNRTLQTNGIMRQLCKLTVESTG
uniref:Uncharacterized protein n=1 Tax=Arundo donax TaxID=35708 RepID=A0A0A8YUI0_ARUDO